MSLPVPVMFDHIRPASEQVDVSNGRGGGRNRSIARRKSLGIWYANVIQKSENVIGIILNAVENCAETHADEEDCPFLSALC